MAMEIKEYLGYEINKEVKEMACKTKKSTSTKSTSTKKKKKC